MDQYHRELIAQEFRACVGSAIYRARNHYGDYKPFHAALLPDEVLFWSAFERSFSTSFGQRVIEEVARLVVLSTGITEVSRQKESYIRIDRAQEEVIHRHMQDIRMHRPVSSWDGIIEEIQNTRLSGYTVELRIISDLWWRRDGIDNFVSLKTVKPNMDQTAVAKEDCLHLSVGIPGCNAYFGLPYNPYGERREDYAFNPPRHIFDFRNDSVVLIGREMWDTIGGEGCYDELLAIARQVGNETREQINNLR